MQENLSNVIKHNPDSGKNKKSEFNEEIRKNLSDSFMRILKEEKAAIEEPKSAFNIVGGDESYKGFIIFKKAIQRLIEEPTFPEKEKMNVRIGLLKLDPFNAGEDNGIWYINSIKNILSVIDKVLTPEISLSVQAFTEKIFIDPLKEDKN